MFVHPSPKSLGRLVKKQNEWQIRLGSFGVVERKDDTRADRHTLEMRRASG